MIKNFFKYNSSTIKNTLLNKKYILSQFPYPSGDLHLGHARVYYIGDSIAKYYKLKNNKVIYPIGWDSFGLPAENAAILHGKNPKQWTQNNIKKMKEQLIHLDIDFNWEMQLSTCQPQYYKWTQKIFINMFKKGIAYKKMAQVNWDPVDKTVLANQQVDQNGNSWRSGAKVQKKMLNQWFLKITDYAQILQNNLDKINWIEKVKNMQKGWINFKNGFKYKIILQNQPKNLIQIYFQHFNQWQQATFIIKKLNKENKNIQFNQRKIGQVYNPVTGKKLILIESDKQQSQNFILINMKYQKNINIYTDIYKIFQNQIQQLSNNNQCKGTIQLTQFNKRVQKVKYMKLKDWLISRQRYWGCPIPIIYCKNCGILSVPQKQLPIILPEWKNDGNPLSKDIFKKCKCPTCGNQDAQRQSDTMDTFVDSSWYFLRFLDNNNHQQIFKNINIQKIMPVDLYIGGIQHAIMHLLYARFIMRVIKDDYKLSDKCNEPFKQLVVQGLVKGKTFSLKSNNKYLSQVQVNLGKYSSNQINITYEKMSKSKFNGLNPNILVDKYCSDALRIAIFFANPPDKDIDFSEQIVQNAQKFLKKIQNLWIQIFNKQHKIDQQQQKLDFQCLILLRNIFQKIETSIQKYLMHTYVANLMEMFNLTKQLIQNQKYKLKSYQKIKIFCIFIRILQIVAPKISNKIKQQATQKFSSVISKQEFNIWPNQQIFGEKIEVLIMKGSKMLRKDTVQISMTDQQIIKTLKINQQVLQIKRQKKKFIIIIKQ